MHIFGCFFSAAILESDSFPLTVLGNTSVYPNASATSSMFPQSILVAKLIL